MHVPLQASNATASTSRNNEEPPAMNRKMGQAYLEHSIAELESQLRQVRLMKQQQQQRSKAATERRACLLDISMLVYGLPVVRKWSRSNEYAELLLPIDALTMLDVLKKAEQPLCSQAREAIRWLEWQLSPNNEVSSVRPPQRQNSRSRAQLRILDEDDMVPWSQIMKEGPGSPTCLDDYSEGEVQMRKESLQSLSFGRQTTLRALWTYTSSKIDAPVVAFTNIPTLGETQPDLVKRVLVDLDPLAQTIQYYCPSISLEILLDISHEGVTKAAEDEAAFRSMRQSRLDQRSTDTSGKARLSPGRSTSERQSDRPDSGFQRSINRTPNSSRSSEKVPIPQSYIPAHRPPLASSSAISAPHAILRKSPSHTNATQPSQPQILQKKSTGGQIPAQGASAGVGSKDSQLERPAPPSRPQSRPQREVAKVQPLPTPKITLANPRSTPRSLSTAT